MGRFNDALAAPGLGAIAEIKRRSPSAGDLRPDADPALIASAYAARSASATTVGSDPISTTSAWAIGSTGVGAVTANQASRRRVRSMLVPVKSIAG